MNRYCFYIDGFNVYHALNDRPYRPGAPRVPENRIYPYRKYKWLNYRKLAESLIGERDHITDIVFFTTYAKWKWAEDAGIAVRHKHYVKALRSQKIQVVQGHFKQKDKYCHNCNRTYPSHVEKRTDVNIALQVLGDAIEDLYDRAMIISADSDLLPVIGAVHKYATAKEVGVMFPIGRGCSDLREKADFRFKMSEWLLCNSQFPDVFEVDGQTFQRPESESWK